MSSNDPLYKLIQTVTGTTAGGTTLNSGGPATGAEIALSQALSDNTAQLTGLGTIFKSQAETVAENTRTLAEKTTNLLQNTAVSAGSDVANSLVGAVSGGFLFGPLVSGLMKLFGGGEDASPPPQPKFSLPSSERIEAGVAGTSSNLVPVDYQLNGLPRSAAPSSPNVTVQVNAMDSQSFMDRSEDIANAVRRAMLESSALNDVVSEL